MGSERGMNPPPSAVVLVLAAAAASGFILGSVAFAVCRLAGAV